MPELPPGVEVGNCHVCREALALILFCKRCGHWVCGVCRNRYGARFVQAVKAIFSDQKPPECCGPKEQ